VITRLQWIDIKIDLGKLSAVKRRRAESLLLLAKELSISNSAKRELEELARQSAFGRRRRRPITRIATSSKNSLREGGHNQ